MKKSSVLFIAPIALFFTLVLVMLVLSASATAESTPVNTEPTSVTITKDATVYNFDVTPGTEFYYMAILPKTIPPTGHPGDTVIDSSAFTLDGDVDLPDEPRFYNWAEPVETELAENDTTKVLFYIAVPHDLPAGLYEFTAITDGLEPRIGTTILRFSVK